MRVELESRLMTWPDNHHTAFDGTKTTSQKHIQIGDRVVKDVVVLVAEPNLLTNKDIPDDLKLGYII